MGHDWTRVLGFGLEGCRVIWLLACSGLLLFTIERLGGLSKVSSKDDLTASGRMLPIWLSENSGLRASGKGTDSLWGLGVWVGTVNEDFHARSSGLLIGSLATFAWGETR